MAIWNYNNPAATTPSYGLMDRYDPSNGMQEPDPGPGPAAPAPTDSLQQGGNFNNPQQQQTAAGSTYWGARGGMTSPQFNESYARFRASGAPTGMSYADWMRSGQFTRNRSPFQQATTPTPNPGGFSTKPPDLTGRPDGPPIRSEPFIKPAGTDPFTRPSFTSNDFRRP